LLTDEDGDGRMDKAVTFADHMDNVQGLLPYDGGLIATTRSQILFLKDTDGDNKADLIKPLIRGFNPKHSQLQVSAPRWGPDGCVHFNNGLDAKRNLSRRCTPKVVGIPGSNFKWNPKTGEITPTGGKGQYGGAFDDWGHHFYCSNRNPLMFTVMPYEAMLRNPHAGITQVHEDIATPGAETRVYPLQITHTTADAHAGTNTACSGLGVYRGQLMPELRKQRLRPRSHRPARHPLQDRAERRFLESHARRRPHRVLPQQRRMEPPRELHHRPRRRDLHLRHLPPLDRPRPLLPRGIRQNPRHAPRRKPRPHLACGAEEGPFDQSSL
jgi:putative membrane-bound dehydrogenase-like protein